MAQPVLYQVRTWDATLSGSISFSYSGNQVFKNQVIVRNNATNEVVYDQMQASFQLKHNFLPNSLTNNICYAVQVRVFDQNNVASAWSKTEIFYCFPTPIFRFDGIAENQIVKNSSLQAMLTYEQSSTDPLNSYQFFLYDEHKIKLDESPVLYGQSMKYIYSNLEDKAKYFVRATGETVNRMVLDTGYVAISVQYILPSSWVYVDLTNLYRQGTVRIHCNFISIEGKSNLDPVPYENGMVDLSNGGWVTFDEGFAINGDFTLQMDITALVVNGYPLVLSNGREKIQVKFMMGQTESIHTNEGYMLLHVDGAANFHYVGMSNYFVPPTLENQRVSLWLRRISNIYEIKAAIKEVVV